MTSWPSKKTSLLPENNNVLKSAIGDAVFSENRNALLSENLDLKPF